MPTSLGGGQSTGMKLMVKNNDAGSGFKKGSVLTWGSVAAGNPVVVFLDLTRNKDFGTGTVQQIEIPVITAFLATADAATPGIPGRLGVLAADIKAGGYAEIVTFGLAQCLFGGAVATGEVATPDATGRLVDAANAAHKNPVAILVEAGGAVAGDLKWCFVNFLSPGGVSGTGFMGKAY